MDKRIEFAELERCKEPVDKTNIIEIIKQCLSDCGIDGEIITLNPLNDKIDYKDIQKKSGIKKEHHIIWLEFVKGGHVAVVGAGKDIGFPTNLKQGTSAILAGIKDVEWDKSYVLLIAVKGLSEESVGLKNLDKFGNSILRCRNGVEHLIGEWLHEKNVPILNYFQHLNYSEKFWNNCKNNDYIIR